MNSRDFADLMALDLLPAAKGMYPGADMKQSPHEFGGMWPWLPCWCGRMKDSPTGIHSSARVGADSPDLGVTSSSYPPSTNP